MSGADIVQLSDIVQCIQIVERAWCNKQEFCKKFLPANCDSTTTTELIALLAERCPELTEVNLAKYLGISDSAVFALAEHCSNLK